MKKKRNNTIKQDVEQNDEYFTLQKDTGFK